MSESEFCNLCPMRGKFGVISNHERSRASHRAEYLGDIFRISLGQNLQFKAEI